ncbi:unnamed protein product [Parnassius apollo]|uniref:(apollo) hypothetical protein n=1 Tax=Parnassius apollo TaxID=110799 RepID=A0A8S3XUX9_PARAO|nr:unnamed protein product [Parnassius apollo]
MDVHFVDRDDRRQPLNYELLQDVLGDGCQSDLDISDEETEPAVNAPRLPDDEDDIPSEIPPSNHDRDSDSDHDHDFDSHLQTPATSKCLIVIRHKKYLESGKL